MASFPRLPQWKHRSSFGLWSKCWQRHPLSSTCPLACCSVLALPCGHSMPVHGTTSSAMVGGRDREWYSILCRSPVYLTHHCPCTGFLPAEARIQRGCQRLSPSQRRGSEAATGQYSGVLGQLLEKGQLSLDLIKANITELMAGGVDTVRVDVCFLTASVWLTLCKLPLIFSTDSSAPAVCAVWAWSKPRGAGEGEAAGTGVMDTGRRWSSESPAGGATTERHNQGGPQVQNTRCWCLRLYHWGNWIWANLLMQLSEPQMKSLQHTELKAKTKSSPTLFVKHFKTTTVYQRAWHVKKNTVLM